VPDKLKTMIVKQMQNILARAGKKIVEANNIVAFIKKSFTKVRADKARAAGN
jgi:hypothetical protein